jgi:hypothetical protein
MVLVVAQEAGSGGGARGWRWWSSLRTHTHTTNNTTPTSHPACAGSMRRRRAFKETGAARGAMLHQSNVRASVIGRRRRVNAEKVMVGALLCQPRSWPFRGERQHPHTSRSKHLATHAVPTRTHGPRAHTRMRALGHPPVTLSHLFAELVGRDARRVGLLEAEVRDCARDLEADGRATGGLFGGGVVAMDFAAGVAAAGVARWRRR